MVNVTAVEVPPPGSGVTRVTWAVPATATSEGAMSATTSWLLLTKVVGRGLPFHCTTDDATKLLPVTVRPKSAWPAVALLGESELTAGSGFPVAKWTGSPQ